MRGMWLAGQLALVLALGTGGAVAGFDPMAPPVKVTVGAEAGAVVQQDKTLAWVRLDGRNSVAWYGGKAVKLGDAVEGGQVSAIREDHIVISGRGGSRGIYLLDRSVRGNRLN
ncbi:MAG TPA: hypothetical protein PLE48_13620 [Thiobacillus sp.]|nr:hypothetical protein [Thiobacillus sp.]HQT71445.1 hypothetical protein [Thiobacillus sp.]